MIELAKLNRLREELKVAQDRDDSSINIQSFRVAVEELNRLCDAYEALANETYGVDDEIINLRNELASLRMSAIKIEAERDAVVEMHKQIFQEVLNARNPNQTPQDPS